MHRRYIWLAVALAVLIVSATGYILAGDYLYAQYQTSLSSYTTSCDALISWNPPTRLYTGLYVNAPSLATVRYRSQTRQTLRISLSIPQFTQEDSVDVTATSSFQQHAFKPQVLGSAALDALVGPSQRAAKLHLQVQSLNKVLCDTSAPVTLFSRQWMSWRDPVSGDNSAYLAGWVTPNAPVISELIGRAADRLAASPTSYPSTMLMHGYVGHTTADDVRGQVNALFDTLQFNYHVHYASDNIPFNQDATQRIQLPEDILTQSAPTGMCVETTAILASAIERLGMFPYIIIVPGHAFLGVALGADQGAPIEYWETSDLNGATGSQAHADGQSEYLGFQQSNQIQRVIDIQYERHHGIQPIE
ncbi:MAG TPA: hypothetical protein VH591_15420 [Ktedonobacterales bacterium]|jgi:hypothetical protein